MIKADRIYTYKVKFTDGSSINILANSSEVAEAIAQEMYPEKTVKSVKRKWL